MKEVIIFIYHLYQRGFLVKYNVWSPTFATSGNFLTYQIYRTIYLNHIKKSLKTILEILYILKKNKT